MAKKENQFVEAITPMEDDFAKDRPSRLRSNKGVHGN